MVIVCAGCGHGISWLRAVRTTLGESWHWRCYHVEVDTVGLPDGTSRKMTHDEWLDHQKWADGQHDGQGNQKAK